MIKKILFLSCLLFLFSKNACADYLTIEGKIVSIDIGDKTETPKNDLRLGLRNKACLAKNNSDKNGIFQLSCDPKKANIKLNDLVNLNIFGDKWYIITPNDGQFEINDIKYINLGKIRITSKKSKLYDSIFNQKEQTDNNEQKQNLYKVQVIVTVSRDNALEIKNKLIKSMFRDARIEVKKIDDTVFYYVFTGKYPTLDRAKEIQSLIKERFPEYKNPMIK